MTAMAQHQKNRLGLILAWYSRARHKQQPCNSFLRRSLSSSSSSTNNFSSSSSSCDSSTTTTLSPIYVAATRQHVGKTSTSMALLSGLQKRFGNDKVGFMKPVGQQSLQVQNSKTNEMIQIDKDAVLIKEYFNLHHIDYQHISPILIPKGYTRDYLDGKIKLKDQEQLVQTSYNAICQTSNVVLCEGTGHCAVGSIVHASNAQVASWLNAKMVLVANGGLGNTFDELQLNKVLCDKEGVDVAGVIVNKVQPDKLQQTQEYIQKALDLHWGNSVTGETVPLLGCIPDRPFLGCPALSDLEKLFGTQLLTGQQHRLRHYQVQDLNLVATSLDVFMKKLQCDASSRTLYVCHASRNDILKGFLLDHPNNYYDSTKTTTTMSSSSSSSKSNRDSWFGGAVIGEAALIVTGMDDYTLSDEVLELIQNLRNDGHAEMAPPVLLAPLPTHKVMDMIHRYTPKLNFEDSHRANKAVEHYEHYIDFDLLLERVGYDENHHVHVNDDETRDDTDVVINQTTATMG